jgi:FixJ family two-component response regulator
MNHEARAKVFVVDDDPSVRRALARMLASAGYRVEAFGCAEEFLRQPSQAGPACAVVDVRMPGLSGLDLQQALATRGCGLPLVFITGHGDIPMTVRAMKAGAVNFLPKPIPDTELLAAVREAVSRHAAASQAAAEAAVLCLRAGALSPREREVMDLVVRGLPNKVAARRLGVGEKTVKAHRAQVMRKMRAESLPDLVRMAQKIATEATPPQECVPR